MGGLRGELRGGGEGGLVGGLRGGLRGLRGGIVLSQEPACKGKVVERGGREGGLSVRSGGCIFMCIYVCPTRQK